MEDGLRSRECDKDICACKLVEFFFITIESKEDILLICISKNRDLGG